MGWRRKIGQCVTDISEKYIFYQFGVYNGDSIAEVYNSFRDAGKNINNIYGFDSFIGFPPTNENYLDILREGELNSCKCMGASSVEDCINKIMNKLQQQIPSEIKLIPGFFCDSLNDTVPTFPANYIDIDVDLYSSAYEVLDFCYSKNIIVPNTLVGYDDWGCSPNWQTCGDGESLAHVQMCEKYKVKMELLYSEGSSFPHIHKLYRVNEIG